MSVSPDLVYRYRMTVKDADEVLDADLKKLKATKQVSIIVFRQN